MSAPSNQRPLSAAQLADLAGQLRSILDLMDGGSMTASSATRYRIEGALSALEAALGLPSTLLDGLVRPGSDNK